MIVAEFFFRLGFVETLSMATLVALLLVAVLPAGRLVVLRSLGLVLAVQIHLLSLGGFFLLGPVNPLLLPSIPYRWLPGWNWDYLLAVDGLSLPFLVLSTFLLPVCILASWESIRYRLKEFLLLLFFTQLCLLNAFGTVDLLLFYLFFEAVALPTFAIIGLWGSRPRRIVAAFKFFLYTLAGSVVMLVAILYLYVVAGSLSLYVLYGIDYSPGVEQLLWLAFFLAFAVKVPMVPVHVWLPEAHVEAPTAGSVLLAGILLKLGGYGLLRFSLPLFPTASLRFAPLVFLLSLVAIGYGSLTTLLQVDLKKAVAYSSVAHMNYVTLGLFTHRLEGLEGAVLLMLSHGLVSSALFLLVGFLYDRYGSRLLRYYGGLAAVMPLYATFFLFFGLANLGLPGTSSFAAEFLVVVGAFLANSWVGLLAATGVIFSAAYTIWLFNRLCFGPVPTTLVGFADLNGREGTLLVLMAGLVLLFGLRVSPVLALLHLPLEAVLLPL